MKIRLAMEISLPSGIFDVELCHSIVHFGSSVLKNLTKCRCTAVWPEVPETRGTNIGERSAPTIGSKSEPPEGMLCKKLSDSGLYACAVNMWNSMRNKSDSQPLERIEASMVKNSPWERS